jgi:hypothetical protein
MTLCSSFLLALLAPLCSSASYARQLICSFEVIQVQGGRVLLVASEGKATSRKDVSHMACHPGFRYPRHHRTVSKRACSSVPEHFDHRGACRIDLCLGMPAVIGRGWLQEREQVGGVLLNYSTEALAGLRFIKKFHT